MIKQMVVYLAVFFLTLCCFFLYSDEIMAIMLAAEVIYPAAAIIGLQYLKRKIDVFIEPVIPIAEKNQEIPITLVIQNRSRIPSVHVKILIQAENQFTKERQKYYQKVRTGSDKTERVTIILKSKNCGMIDISIKTYWIYDMLYILKEKKNKKEVQRVGILPECRLLPVEITKRTREFIADAEEYSDRESGDDPSEIYQIREYREKDSLHDIHWKLSAKADELLVKEHGRPLGSVVLIWLNMRVLEKKKNHIPAVILEAAASLSMSLLEAECVHMVAWYEPENHKIQKKRVSKEENIYELLNRLLYISSYQENIEGEYEEAFKGISFSTIVEFQADGTIVVNEEETMKISLQEGKTDWRNLYFVC